MNSSRTLNVATSFRPPTRLAAQTRELAFRGLSGEFGRAMANAGTALRDRLPSVGVSEEMRYAKAVALIAETAPLRILEGEWSVGSATYREATTHLTPILGDSSTSHLTPGFDNLLRIGYRGLRERIERKLASEELDDPGIDLLESMLVCLDAANLWHRRHLDLLASLIEAASGAQRAHYEALAENLRNVPELPPTTFREAVQALWFTYAFQRLVGNWPGIGRIDQMLGPFLERDLADERITIAEARELLAHFWIKGTEWIGSREWGSGDAQHYQNIVLSGVDSEGNDVTNAVTYLVLDIVEELHISDFPVAVRVGRDTSPTLWRRVAGAQRLGGGIVSIYNDDVIIPALVGFGFPLSDARGYANDGCWEVLIPGKTAFAYAPFDLLEVLQTTLGLTDPARPLPSAPTFEALYARFTHALAARLDTIQKQIDAFRMGGPPAGCISMLVEGCIEHGRGYNDRGPTYTIMAPHAGGMADVANSLLAIRKLVYEEQRLTLAALVECLRQNWSGQERLRQEVRATIPTFGNDDDEADAMLTRVFDTYTTLARRDALRAGVYRPAGISTFGREIEWRAHRKATAHGFREGDILANNFSPTPGTDRLGPTAVIKSQCKVDFTRLPNGATLELKLHPSAVEGEAGIEALISLLRVYCRLGGWYLNVDVIDSATLIEAQQHPERFHNLAVRVSGWCARFNTLSKEWQDMIIQRTQQMVG
jgi:pyruvate-formate lyase